VAIERYPAQSSQRQRVAAWIALALSILYPLNVVFTAIFIQIHPVPKGVNGMLLSLYTPFICIEYPLSIVATFLAVLVLREGRGNNRVAWIALTIGLLSITSATLAVIGLMSMVSAIP